MPYIDVVDDAKYITIFLENLLKRYNLNCRVFNDSDEYISKLKEKWKSDEYPSLILLDLMMPKLSGYEIISIIKNDERLKNIPIIVVTIKNQLEDVVECIKMGANDYIIKPFESDVLIDKIKKLLKLQ